MAMTTTMASGGLRPVQRPYVAGAYGAAALCAAGLVAVYFLFVLNQTGQQLDDRALELVMARGSSARAMASELLSTVSVQILVVGVLAAMLIAVLRRRFGLALLVAGLVLAANVTTQVLKLTLHRPGTTEGLGNSLPSGHATAALSLAVALIAAAPLILKPLVVILGGGYAAAVAVATVVAGWHRPSDILAAGLVVLAWSFLALGLSGIRAGRRPRPGPNPV